MSNNQKKNRVAFTAQDVTKALERKFGVKPNDTIALVPSPKNKVVRITAETMKNLQRFKTQQQLQLDKMLFYDDIIQMLLDIANLTTQ